MAIVVKFYYLYIPIFMAKKAARIDRRIDVILLEGDKHLGEKYEMVKVKAIFAKNVLFPNNRAVLATADATNSYRTKMEQAAKMKEKKASDLTSLFEKIANDGGIQFEMKANEKGALYEKIDPAHIVARVQTLYSIAIDDHLFKMKKKITQTGEYLVPFKYGTVDKDIRIVVKEEKAKKAEATESTDAA